MGDGNEDVTVVRGDRVRPFTAGGVVCFYLGPSFVVLFYYLVRSVGLRGYLDLTVVVLRRSIRITPRFGEIESERRALHEDVLDNSRPRDCDRVASDKRIVFRCEEDLNRGMDVLDALVNRTDSSIFHGLNVAIVYCRGSPFAFVPGILFVGEGVRLRENDECFAYALEMIRDEVVRVLGAELRARYGRTEDRECCVFFRG